MTNEMHKFLQKYRVLKWIQEKTENKNKPKN
jgi:hypothetical protein